MTRSLGIRLINGCQRDIPEARHVVWRLFHQVIIDVGLLAKHERRERERWSDRNVRRESTF